MHISLYTYETESLHSELQFNKPIIKIFVFCYTTIFIKFYNLAILIIETVPNVLSYRGPNR